MLHKPAFFIKYDELIRSMTSRPIVKLVILAETYLYLNQVFRSNQSYEYLSVTLSDGRRFPYAQGDCSLALQQSDEGSYKNVLDQPFRQARHVRYTERVAMLAEVKQYVLGSHSIHNARAHPRIGPLAQLDMIRCDVVECMTKPLFLIHHMIDAFLQFKTGHDSLFFLME